MPAKKRPHSYCARLSCRVNNVNTLSIRFHHIPAFPKDLPVGARQPRYIKREGIILLHKDIADWCHFKRGLKEEAYRICVEHEFETVTKSIQLMWGKNKNGNGKQWTQSYELFVPVGAQPNSTMCLRTKDSRGIGTDRLARRTLKEVNHQIKKAPRGPFVTAVSYLSKNKCSPSKTKQMNTHWL